MMRSVHTIVALALAAAALLTACGDNSPDNSKSGTGTSSGAPAQADAGGHGGAVIVLGDAAIGEFQAHVTRDQGAIVAGKDAPIDVTVKPAAGSTARVSAVRFWIGLEDGKASVKAKAEVENPAEPDRWHTHAEIPDPLPAGSRLWVEVESASGTKAIGSFDLKT